MHGMIFRYDMVKAEQGVSIAELHATSAVKKSEGEATSTRLRAAGEADAIRATDQAKAEAYRVVPDVLVSGANGSASMMDALMAMMARQQAVKTVNV